jgi:hypothetical protein
MVYLLSTLPIIRKRLALSTTIFSRHDRPPDHFDDLRDDGVSEASQAVHSGGNPMSHSTHVGFNVPIPSERTSG